MTKDQNQASAMTDIEDMRDKWKIVDGDCREGADGLITYHVNAFDEGYKAALATVPERSDGTTPAQQTEAPKDAELIAILPGTYYMDMPDGGSVTILEQLQRMAKDAERYRWIVSNEKEASNVVEQYGICYLAGYIDADLERAATAKEKRNE